MSVLLSEKSEQKLRCNEMLVALIKFDRDLNYLFCIMCFNIYNVDIRRIKIQ